MEIALTSPYSIAFVKFADRSVEVKTYEQALSFLNVSEDFADDAVVAMFTTKASLPSVETVKHTVLAQSFSFASSDLINRRGLLKRFSTRSTTAIRTSPEPAKPFDSSPNIEIATL